MDKLVFKDVSKRFGKVIALEGFNLEIKEHELIVILGTSGSGKSTLLRIIAGLENSFEGDILLNNKPLEEIEIRDRKVAMVFQSYALYPQMTAYSNLVLSLKQNLFYRPTLDKNGQQKCLPDYEKIYSLKDEIRNLPRDSEYKIKKQEFKNEIKSLKKNPTIPMFSYQSLTPEEIEERLDKIVKILDLSSFINQRTSTLSGGQKQRVALGKALLREPEILLLDEPLSSLDAKLRANSRELIRRVHQKANATTIVTSHDQNDAYALADRVVVLDEGIIQQVGTIDEVYNHPNNVTVAKFFGNPSMNLIECYYDGEYLKVNESNSVIPLSSSQKEILKDYINKGIIFGVRPENISIGTKEEGLKTVFDKTEIFGKDLLHHVYLDENEILIRSKEKIKYGVQDIFINFDEKNVLFFAKDSGKIID